MRIEWDTCSVNDWYDIYNRIPRTNIVQSYAYARAMRQLHQQVTRFGLILSNTNETLGLVQMQEINLMNIIHRVFIDRGPLWCDPDHATALDHEFWKTITQTYPKRIGRKRRFIPEIQTDHSFQSYLKQLGCKEKGPGYQTIFLDLRPSLKDIRTALHGKWRNGLNQAEKTKATVHDNGTACDINLLLMRYNQDRNEKSYRGADPAFIRALEKTKTPYEYSFILSVTIAKKDPVAMGYFRIHGRSATYQIGWINDTGRRNRANYLLLWQAVKRLKANGIEWLDLGGINPDHAAGVTRFKRRMNGIEITTPGIYG